MRQHWSYHSFVLSHQHIIGDTIVSHYAIPMPQCSRTEGCAGLCSTVPTRPWEGTNLFGAPARVMPGVAKGTHSRRDFPLAFFIFNLEGHTSFNPNNKLITSYNVWLSLHNWLHLTWRVWRHDIKNMYWFLDELIRVFQINNWNLVIVLQHLHYFRSIFSQSASTHNSLYCVSIVYTVFLFCTVSTQITS